jgi:chromosome partitioning protein
VPIWGVVNQKGGVGKTTTAVNLAAGLALRGASTLLIDSDPQGNATTGLGIDKQKAKTTLYDILIETAESGKPSDKLDKTIIHVTEHLDVIPSTLDLAGADSVLYNSVGKEMILKEALAPLASRYEWIIFDAPPSLGLLTINILAAVEVVLVPMQCEFYALEGLSQLLKTIDVVKRRINPSLEIGKVLLTMHDPRNRLTQQVAKEVQDYFGKKVSRVVIPRNVKLSESPSFGEAAVTRFRSSKGALAYMQLVDEVLNDARSR